MKSALCLCAAIPFLFSSCRVAVKQELPGLEPEIPAVVEIEKTEADTPRKIAAILLSESNLQYAPTASFTGGPDRYRSLLTSLKDALGGHGINADFISEEDLLNDRLRHYCILYIVDTFDISANSEAAIHRFAEHGGVVVGLNEVGRVQGSSWTTGWHYEKLFGVRALNTDQYGTALSLDTNRFQHAGVTKAGVEHLLTRGLSNRIEFGKRSLAIWATTPETATVLASFPSYTRVTREDPDRRMVVKEPVVAISVNNYGKGFAVWIAPNVHDRKLDSWPEAGHTLEILARCTELARPEVIIPQAPPSVIIGISQLGYVPDERKQAILRIPFRDSPPFSGGTFSVTTSAGETALQGKLTPEGPDNPWRDYYYIADFSSLSAEGDYRFTAELQTSGGHHYVTGCAFRIASNLWTKDVIPTQYSFLRNYRCGAICHTNDPIRGGYHDASGDYAVRMWSMPHVVYGLAENILASQQVNEEALEELLWAVSWMIKMMDESGQVHLSVKPVDDWSPLDKRPPVDPTPRMLEKGWNLNYQTTYVVGMAHAARALRKTGSRQAEVVLRSAVKACERMKDLSWENTATGDTGNYLWGLTELYLDTRNDSFLSEARRIAPLILERQWLKPDKAEAGLYGDFLEGPGKNVFGERQYKKFHAFGVYFGLIELASALPESDPLRERTVEALNIYFQQHVLRGAALTPYGQMITALEPRGDGTFKLYFFTHLDSWVRLHGLNCDHLGIALAALRLEEISPLSDLRGFAHAQAQWLAGFNPLGYCMIDQLGFNTPPIPEVGTGRFTGGIPNGIVGDLRDRPIWGVTWDSREYWLPHNAYLLALAPHLERK